MPKDPTRRPKKVINKAQLGIVQDSLERLLAKRAEKTELMEMFQGPGWIEIASRIKEQKDAAYAGLTQDGPLNEYEIYSYRAELQVLERLLSLDETIISEVKSIDDEIKSLQGQLAQA